MSDTPSSGSRWEPGPDADPTTPLAAAQAEATEPPASEDPAPQEPAAAPPTSDTRRTGRRTKAILAGSALGLLLVGGLGGFALGWALAGDESTPSVVERDTRDGGRGFPGAPPGGGDGRGFPEGTAPDGTAPDGTAPDGTTPEGTTPEEAAPEDDTTQSS